MKSTHKRLREFILITLFHAITLVILQWFMPGIQITSFMAAVGAAIAYSISQAAFWYIFIQYLTWLPPVLYPILTFVLSGVMVMITANLIPGITIVDWTTGLWIMIWMTVVNAILGGLVSLDEESVFDRVVIQRMVSKKGKATQTDVPGFLFLEIDGLSESVLKYAIQEGYMPNIQRWLESGSYCLTGWETDFTSQTGAMQTGILLGSNNEIPAYRWWDRAAQKVMKSGSPRDAAIMEARLSTGRGLLSDGGASRGNMFSGNAAESLLTMSTAMDKSHPRGPSFYFYLLSPYVLARLVTRFIGECMMEWRDAWSQKRRKDPYRVKARSWKYAFLRGFMGPVLQDLATYMVISDVLRGIPAIYALYAAYDDLAHFAGLKSKEALRGLHEIDRYFARIEKLLEAAPRPYHLIVLSDHGQTTGFTFKNQYGVTLEELVDALIQGHGDVYAAQKTHETWDKLSILLTESVNEDTRTAKIIGTALKNRREGDLVEVGPQTEDEIARQKKVVVVASGGAGLIYFTQAKERKTAEQISREHPGLVLGLVNHPGVGFVLVKSEEHGSMVMGKTGINFLDEGVVEGEDPLAGYGPNAVRHLKRESGFANCPDLLVSTDYNPTTEEMWCFEDQASHHGAMGGPQNHAVLIHPISLPTGNEPIVTAEGLHQVLRGWRVQAQGLN